MNLGLHEIESSNNTPSITLGYIYDKENLRLGCSVTIDSKNNFHNLRFLGSFDAQFFKLMFETGVFAKDTTLRKMPRLVQHMNIAQN
jgi:hypothetical protein